MLTSSPVPIGSATSTPWFVQTGLTLTSSTAESKGQTWLSKRESSTALTSPSMTPPFRTPIDEPREYGFPASVSTSHTTASSRPYTPATRSRRASRSRVSRRDLAMTPAAAAEKLVGDSHRKSRSGSSSNVSFVDGKPERKAGLGDVPGGTRPDWADEETKKEALRDEMDREMETGGLGTDRDLFDHEEDVFEYVTVDGGLGEENDNGFSGEEQELQKQLGSNAFGIGKWVDGWVDALLQVGDDYEEGDVVGIDGERASPTRETDMLEGRSKRADRQEGGGDGTYVKQADADDGDRAEAKGDSPRETAPLNPATIWEDVRWLGRLVWDTATS